MTKKLLDIDTLSADLLPTEAEVMANWLGDIRTPVVSVLCISYNHSQYINDCLRGIIKQKTSVAFEIVIYDDRSTDNSRELIDLWEGLYPNIIKKIYPSANQYSKGNRALWFLLKNSTASRYLSFCECDDYWLDEVKLQTQYEALEARLDINICCHPALTLRSNQLDDLRYGFHGTEKTILPIEKVIFRSGSLMPMASIFMRRESLMKFWGQEPKLYKHLLRHTAVQVLGANPAGVLYLPKYMSIYRSMHSGSWTNINTFNEQVKFESLLEFFKRNETLNRVTNYNYDELFKKVLHRRISSFMADNNIRLTSKFTFFYKLLKLNSLNKESKFLLFYYTFYGSFRTLLKTLIKKGFKLDK